MRNVQRVCSPSKEWRKGTKKTKNWTCTTIHQSTILAILGIASPSKDCSFVLSAVARGFFLRFGLMRNQILQKTASGTMQKPRCHMDPIQTRDTERHRETNKQ